MEQILITTVIPTMSTIININNDATPIEAAGHKSILFFWAEWHPSSSAGGSFDAVFNTLAMETADVKFYRVEAEAALGVSKKVSSLRGKFRNTIYKCN